MTGDPSHAQPSGTAPGASAPPLPDRFVSRPRVVAAVRRGAERGILLVAGGAGTGKTAAVADWFGSDRTGSGSWLSVGERHNDPARLVADVVDALALTAPARAAVPGEVAGCGALDRALQQVERRRRPTVLVLDDVHVLQSSASAALLQHLLLNAPACLRLVVTTRAWRPVGITRLRLRRGGVAILPGSQLAFLPEEAAELLSSQGLPLAPDVVEDQVRMTGGWPAAMGVLVDGLACAEGARPLAQIDTATQERLWRDVVADMDAATRSFVLRTSVSDRVSTDLAEVLTGDPQAGERLEQLIYDGSLLVPLDGPGRWYRYHDTASRLLRRVVSTESPGTYQELLRAAARWFDERDAPADADALAARTGDWELLTRLRCRRWMRDTVSGRPGPTPAPPIAGGDGRAWTPELGVLLVASAASRGDEALATRHRARVDLEVPLEETEEMPLVGARLLMDAVYGTAFGADDRVRMALDVLEEAGGLHRGLRPFTLLSSAEVQLDDGAFAEARTTLGRAVEEAVGSGTRWVAEEGQALQGLLDAALGRRAEAEAALLGTDLAGGPRIAAMEALTEAILLGYRGDLKGARTLLASMDPSSLAGVRVLRLGWLAVAHALASSCSHSEVVASRELLGHPFAEQILAGLGCLEGRAGGGRSVVLGGRPGAALLRARRSLEAGQWREATTLGMEVLDGGDEVHPCLGIEAAVVVGAASLHRGDESTAVAMLRTALLRSESSGLIAPLLRQADALRFLLAGPAVEVVSLARDALNVRDQVVVTEGPAFVEPLTDREQAVLRCLPSLMSNADIASELVVSVNTVKTHLKAVYRKLGVTRRREALARARHLELL